MAEKEARLIDANIFIRDLTAMKSMYDAITLDGMIKALKEAPTIDPESLRPQWISVKDRLPDVDTFLGISRFNVGVQIYKVRPWEPGWTVGGLKIEKDMKYWMPLPEPPKEA